MRGILSFIVVLGALFDTGHCQSGYTLNPITGNSYKVLKDQGRTWDEAKSKCESEGTELASIRTTGEWNFVKGLFGSISGYVFLGGTDTGKEGKWVWTDGSPVPRLPAWYPNKPSTRSSRNCIVAVSKWEWRWVDGTCSNRFYAVCKKPGGLLHELKNLKKLSELSIGITLEEYEAKEIQCSKKGRMAWFDINTGNCYIYEMKVEKVNWAKAREACQELGGELASIKSRKEHEVIKGRLQGIKDTYLWLGGTNDGEEGAWVWIDGSPVTFSNWQAGFPFGDFGGKTYIFMKTNSAYPHYSWKWLNALPERECNPLCKIPVYFP